MRVAVFLALVAAAFGAQLFKAADQSKAIAGQYIVVLNEDADVSSHLNTMRVSKLLNTYTIGSFKGYAARMDKQQIDTLLARSDVKYVEEDAMVYLEAPVLAVANSDDEVPVLLEAGTDDEFPIANGGTDDKFPIANGGTDDEFPIATGGTDDEFPIATGGTDDEFPIATGGTDDEFPIATGGTDDEFPIATGGTDDEFPIATGGTDEDFGSGEQRNPTWGIDRIDQTDLPLNNLYKWDNDGESVDAYILDTGIRSTHNDFGGRAIAGADFTGEGPGDGNGHGTHVAGTVGGTTYGVAKKVTLIEVKVLGRFGSGSFSGIIGGVDFTTSESKKRGRKAVANMSLGGGVNRALNDAVDASSAQGVLHVVASGNNNGNACNNSPASATSAFTVNACDISDAKASFSNYGSCTDIYAPGVSITSAWITSDSSTNTISGTSMASPHICGVAALYMDAGMTGKEAQSYIVSKATAGKIKNNPSATPNLLVYSLA